MEKITWNKSKKFYKNPSDPTLLLDYTDYLSQYADVMNNAKKRAPGFTKVEYQELPDGEENRVFSEGVDCKWIIDTKENRTEGRRLVQKSEAMDALD